jgi:hypothetical protein
MRWVLIIVGIVVALVGIAWILQGTNVWTGSPVMSGHRRWIVIGAGLDVVGAVLIIIGSRMRRATS